MNAKLPKILFGLLIAGLVAETGYLHWRVVFSGKKEKDVSLPAETVPVDGERVVIPADSEAGRIGDCTGVCLSVAREEVARAVATLSAQPTTGGNKAETVLEKTPSVTLFPQLSYLPLGAGGSTASLGWVEIPGSRFVFDLSDYPGTATAVWEVNLRAEHAQSRCYARVYDVSNLRAVDFSEQTTDSTSSVNLISLPLSVWRGKNDYYLEAKSLNGVRCYLDSPRLKIVVK